MAIAASLLPRSWWSLTAVFFFLTATVVGLVLLDGQSVALAADASSQPLYWLLMDRPASIAAWWASTLWMGMAVLAVVLFGLCRSRMDDLKSGYRWWLVAATASIALSLNATTSAHSSIGELLANGTGFAPLGTGAFWWLAPGAVVFGAIGLRLLMDLSDSSGAMGLACLGAVAISAGCVVEAGLVSPQSLASVSPLLASPLLAPAANLAGISLVVMSLLFFSRRIVLEVKGTVAPSVQKAQRKASKVEKTPRKDKAHAVKTSLHIAEEPSEPEPRRLSASERRAARRAAKTEAQPQAAQPKKEETSWVSGGDGYQDAYEEEPTRRKLSKSERKRLRKLKARRAA